MADVGGITGQQGELYAAGLQAPDRRGRIGTQRLGEGKTHQRLAVAGKTEPSGGQRTFSVNRTGRSPNGRTHAPCAAISIHGLQAAPGHFLHLGKRQAFAHDKPRHVGQPRRQLLAQG
ncbi:MAG: hypothetical protein LW854_13660, partial [Rubrivivax sp.]|nr:hypothetical protein [Rubrivivax sp.]